jgi:hypothetical protein
MVDDEVLVSQARSGNPAAFVEFATRWWPIIARVAWSLLGNEPQALAVTEEVLDTTLCSRESFEQPVRFSMYRLAVWLAFARRRSEPRPDGMTSMDRAALALRDVEDVSVADAAVILEIPAEEIRMRLHRARMALVPEAMRAVLTRRARIASAAPRRRYPPA